MLGASKDPPISSEGRSNYLVLSNVHPCSWTRVNRLLKQHSAPILLARLVSVPTD